MNPDTGHLKQGYFEEYDRQKGYQPVPEWLDQEARLILNGKNQAYVDLDKPTRIASYMKRLRRKRRKKNSIAKASRRKNR